MSTTLRPELSDKSPYYLEKHRYYELKHFCLQYPTWRSAYHALDGLMGRPSDCVIFFKDGHSDPTGKCAETRLYYRERMDMLESIAKNTDDSMWNYILRAVTDGLSYDVMRTRYDIPCSKDCYYKLYRRFFWLLHKKRG